jgi:hypothetical protein
MALVVVAALSGGVGFAQGSAGLGQGGAAQSEALKSGVDAGVSRPVGLSYGTPGVHVTVLENTLIRVMTDQGLSTKRSKNGTAVTFTVSEDVIVKHVLVIPRGATVLGEVVQDKKAGVMSGTPELTLKLESLELGGESYPLYSYQFRVRGESKTPPSVDGLVNAAFYGAIAGDVVAARTSKEAPTRAKTVEDAAAVSAVAAGAVAAASAVTPRPVVELPAEAQMDFYLASPISVQPVSEKEAEALSQRVHPGGPRLYVRGDTP